MTGLRSVAVAVLVTARRSPSPRFSLPYTYFSLLARCQAFRQSPAYLEQPAAPPDDSTAAVLQKTAAFYQQQLDHSSEAMRYRNQRGLQDPALIKELQIG
jgi:hypothetical protein